MAGNPYKDKAGHYTTKENNGGECRHGSGLKSQDFDENMKLKGKTWTQYFDNQELEKQATEKYGSKVIEGRTASASLFDNKLVSKDGKVADKAVQQRYDEVRKEAERITGDLKSLGLNLVDTEFSVKTGSSTFRKILSKIGKYKSGSQLEVLNDLTDVVRFTHVSKDHDSIVKDTQDLINKVKASPNYELIEVDNKYLQKDPAYKGMHLLLKDKKSNTTFELQIHSEDSLKTKNIVHPMYDKFRENNDQNLLDQMVAYTRNLKQPKGIETIQNYHI